jgi:hypothetical protein
MSWRETVSPTTTLLLLFIASLNVYLVIVSFQGGGMGGDQLSYLTVSLNAEVSNSWEQRVRQWDRDNSVENIKQLEDSFRGENGYSDNDVSNQDNQNAANKVTAAKNQDMPTAGPHVGSELQLLIETRPEADSRTPVEDIDNPVEHILKPAVEEIRYTGGSTSDEVKASDDDHLDATYHVTARRNQAIPVTATSPLISSEQQSNDSQVDPDTEKRTERTVVLLVSDYRSGSSLLGEMFNQNDDVFYLFEPLMGVVGPSNQKRFLEGLMKCSPKHWGFLRRSRQSGCGEFQGETEEYRSCLKSVNSTAECLKYEITAAKFIRLRGISSLREFGILDRPNVFVLHSFRDPRGTINSRLSYDVVHYNGKQIPRSDVTAEIVGEIAQSLCWRYYNDSVFGDSLTNKSVVWGY